MHIIALGEWGGLPIKVKVPSTYKEKDIKKLKQHFTRMTNLYQELILDYNANNRNT